VTNSIDQLRSTWERLGEDDALWAVMSHPDRKGGRWEIEEFMGTGKAWIADLMANLDEASLSLGNHVLDFGCGVGRLSFALAEHVPEVTGIDIASSMIEQANRLNPYSDRVHFLSYDGQALPFADGTFDSVISLIVVQHMPPAAQLAALIELQRVVRPGGVLALQIPAGPASPVPIGPDSRLAEIVIVNAPGSLTTGAGAEVDLRITNTGGSAWPAGQYVRVGNHWLTDGEPAIWDDGRVDVPKEIASGESFGIRLPVTAPLRAGRFELEVDIVQEFVTWWSQGSRVPVEVTAAEEVAPVAEPEDFQAAMTMGGVPRRLVADLFEHCGCTVVATVADSLATYEWESYIYLVRKGN
jgi:SAM-dependent methyltransferase